MRRAAGLLAALVPILLPSAVSAASQDIIESHRYMMGDNDSRNDSRQICFMEAKRKALDQAGVLIVSELDLSQFEQSGSVSSETTKKRVRSFAAAILKVETIAEHVELQGAASVFDCTVRVSVDLDDVKLRLHAIANDHTTQDKIEAQAGQIQGLETRIKELNDRLQSTAAQPVLRKERTVAIEGLDTAENARLAALQNICRR